MSGRRAGQLIVLEGAEGVGKSTQLRRLVQRLASLGIDALSLREPGGTRLGDAIRALLLDGEHEVGARAEALLFMASRAELIERVVRPALAQRRIVLLDRFFLSTYAYQVEGRGLGEESVREANRLATGGMAPDLTLLLELPAGEGLARAGRRGTSTAGASVLDRIESSGMEFHARVGAAFARFASERWQREHPECGPIVAVDGVGDETIVAERVWAVLGTRWPETFPPWAESHTA